MVDITFNIFEEDFNKNLTHSYNLSVLLGTGRLSYLICNQQQQILALRSYQLSELPAKNPLKQLLIEDSIIREKFRSVRVGVFSPRFSLLPEALFDVAETSSYLGITNSLLRNDKVFYDEMNNLEMANVYAFEEPFIQDVTEHFPEAEFYHISTGLINNFVDNFDSSNSKNIFLNIYDRFVMITVVEKSKLLFHNIFSFKASADCLYYVLLVCKQLGINPLKCPLHIVGDLVAESEIHKLLHKYIKTIHFVNRPNYYLFGDKIQESLPKNFFFDLFSLKLCE